MKNLMLHFLLCLVLFPGSMLQAESQYRLGSGDVITISVYGEPELSIPTVLIPSHGYITYPFLGRVPVSGQTVSEVSDYIYQGLKGDYLIDPKVTVSLTVYRDFFLNGEVESPGRYPYQPGLTVRKAISIGGGFTDRAAMDDITLIREGNNDKGQRVDLNNRVLPGDILTVGESFF
ncbi:MAG: polysaccharide export protein [Marinobacterium sp.]|nr:polysaccharide export protein [Marinobacterium sp.]